MKTKILAGLLAPGAVFALTGGQINAQTVLFADNFNRPANNNLSASTTGQSGTLGTMSYLESWQGSPVNDATLQVNSSGQLLKGQTGFSGAGAVNHNFTDAPIAAAGGFSVSLDVVSFGTQTLDLPDRWVGFGVGLTLAKVMGFGDENTVNTGPRGGIANDNVASQVGTYGVDAWMHPGVADFFVDLSKENKVQVFAGGMLVNQFAVTPTGSKTLTADFSFADFNAGSPVNYTVLFEGIAVTSGNFNWSTTDANYIGFSGRDSTVAMDNLTIATPAAPVPEPATIALALGGAAGLFLRRRRS